MIKIFRLRDGKPDRVRVTRREGSKLVVSTVDVDRSLPDEAGVLVAEARAMKNVLDELERIRSRRRASGWPTCAEYAEWWIEARYERSLLSRRRIRGQKTLGRARRLWSAVKPTLGHLPMQSVTRAHIMRALNCPRVLAYSRDTQVHLLSQLHCMWADAAAVGYVDGDEELWRFRGINPVNGIEAGGADPVPRARISPDEIRVVLERARVDEDVMLYPALLLTVMYAMRPGEVVKLRWGDVLPKLRPEGEVVGIIQLELRKSGRGARLPLHRPVFEALRAVRPADAAPDAKIFRGYDWLRDAFARVSTGCAEAVTLYSLRHAAAEALQAAGADVPSISAVLGHSSIATTTTYLQHLTRVDSLARASAPLIELAEHRAQKEAAE